MAEESGRRWGSGVTGGVICIYAESPGKKFMYVILSQLLIINK